MLYITTKPLDESFKQKIINNKDHLYTISEVDLKKLFSDEFLYPELIQSDDERDNEFINRYDIPVVYQDTPKFQAGDKLIVANGEQLNMIVFS